MEVYADSFIIQDLTPFIDNGAWSLLLKFMPFVLFFELPLTLLVLMGVIKYSVLRRFEGERRPYFPPVSCIITCYEGRDIQQTIRSLTDQVYPGKIEIPRYDRRGGPKCAHTYEAAMEMSGYVSGFENRKLVIVPKWQRGGRVSSLNTGLNFFKRRDHNGFGRGYLV